MSKSTKIQELLTHSKIHKRWEQSYRQSDNEVFFELAYDYIERMLKPRNVHSLLLDAGCGSCHHAIRLTKYGFNIIAVDFSDYILDIARRKVRNRGLDNKVKIQNENLLNLSFENGTFDYVLCWGVLMHIPDVETAILELTRVLADGGQLIISESNMSAMENAAVDGLRTLLHKDRPMRIKSTAGIEVWSETESGKLLTRRMNIPWLIKRLEQENVILVKRRAGQFTELYTKVSSAFMRALIHRFNNFWFKHIAMPHLACGNIVIFEKRCRSS